MRPLLDSESIFQWLAKRGAERPYRAMYSSIWDGIVTDARLMWIPLDDHMVHRGDGVFEALRVIGGKIYLLSEHLQRLLDSAMAIGIRPYKDLLELQEIIEDTVRASGLQEAMVRLFMSRGPGSFSVSPYDTVGTQFYVVVTLFQPMSPEKFERGASAGRSAIAVKESWMAQVKSCNYLPNVMMKKEAIDRGLDFVVGFSAEGFLCESYTENIALVSREGVLLRPKLGQILKGTTMIRVFDLARELVREGLLRGIESRDITEDEIRNAKEIMMLGTTLDVLPVTSYEGRAVGNGTVGLVVRRLLEMLREDQTSSRIFSKS